MSAPVAAVLASELDVSAAADWAPRVGDVVENFGSLGRVLEIDPERGVLLRGMPDQGFAPGAEKWHADPARCRPVL